MKLAILLVLASAGVLKADNPCPNGYTFHEGFCYKLYTSAKTFQDAADYCVDQDGTDLASVLSLSEANFIRSTYQRHGRSRTWIGGFNQGGRWNWVDTSLWSWTSWLIGEPNNSGDRCAALEVTYRDWSAMTCTSTYKFICKGRSLCTTCVSAPAAPVSAPAAPVSAPSWTPVRNACIKAHNNKVLTSISLSDCIAACERSEDFTCCSVDYKPGTKACHLSVETEASLPSYYSAPCYLSGYIYMERVDDACVSAPSWTPVRNACIKAHNNKVLTSISLGDCMAACERSRRFTCCSVDYKQRTKECHLSVETEASLPFYYSAPCYLSGYIYMERVDDECT